MTLILLLITVALSIGAFQNRQVLDRLIFNPYKVHQSGEWYRFISSGFIHADWLHLLVNMFVLYSFGPVVEEYYDMVFGDRSMPYFLILYIGGMVFSILPTYKKRLDQPLYNALGASGAVSSVVFAFILFKPLHELCLYGLLCLPGILFGAGYLFYSYRMDKRGKDNVNHDAHLWGAVYGFLFTLILKPSLFGVFISQLFHFRDSF
ncbi:MAG: rhomboid family intramembrane serine protease [Bacteroidota bacterium]